VGSLFVFELHLDKQKSFTELLGKNEGIVKYLIYISFFWMCVSITAPVSAQSDDIVSLREIENFFIEKNAFFRDDRKKFWAENGSIHKEFREEFRGKKYRLTHEC